MSKNGMIISLNYQSTIKLEWKPKSEESLGERTMRRKRSDEIVWVEAIINNELFTDYFKNQSPNDIKNWIKQKTERNKIQVNLIKTASIDLKKDRKYV